jgi:peroxiredoxin
MKRLLFPFFSLVILTASATNTITGSINRQDGTIQVLIRNSPFDQNVTLLGESAILNGRFELSFELPYDSEIIFSVDDLTLPKQIIKGSNWKIELNIIELSKPDYFGNTKRLDLKRVESSSELESSIFDIEAEIESIRERNRKGNGKIGKNYVSELERYLIDQISKPNSEDFKTKFSTSKTFAYSLSNIKRAIAETKLEEFFTGNFEASFSGLEAVNILYSQAIQIEFLTKELGKSNYFDFIETATSKIEDDKIRQSSLAVLITNAIGRKWTNQQETKEELSAFIDQCNYSELKQWLLEFQEYHGNTLVGSELQDFELKNPNGGEVRFSDYRGKYLLLDFWATWCGPCIKNMKKLPELKTQHNDLEILCVTTEQDTDKVDRFIKRNGYHTSLNFGIASTEKEINSYFNKRAIPLYFLVSPEGIIIDKAVTDPIPMVKKHLEN